MQLGSAVLERKAGDPSLVPQAGSQTGVITTSELLVALELCFPREKYMEKARKQEGSRGTGRRRKSGKPELTILEREIV